MMRSSSKFSLIGFTASGDTHNINDGSVFAKDHPPITDPKAVIAAVTQLLDVVRQRRRVIGILLDLSPNTPRLIRGYSVQRPNGIPAVNNASHILILNPDPDNKIRL